MRHHQSAPPQYEQLAPGDAANAVEQYLDDAAERAAGIFQDRLQVLADRCRLVGDAAFDEIARCIGGELAGDEDVRACDDGLRLLQSVGCTLRCDKHTYVWTNSCSLDISKETDWLIGR